MTTSDPQDGDPTPPPSPESAAPPRRPPLAVTFKKKGTIVIEGAIVVRDEDGRVVPQPPAKHPGIVKLCGCGRSANKPFCDGSHKR